jgi:uncharacterized protein (DUF302 family)
MAKWGPQPLRQPPEEPQNERAHMTEATAETPAGARPISGIVNRRSPLSVAGTVEQLTEAISAAGAKLFVVVDHSGEAERAGLSLRDTKLLVFGNPMGGTPVMQSSPLAALDLPLKVLVWQDDAGAVWMSYLSAEWLAVRHDIPAELAKPLSAVEALASHLAATA